VRILGKLAWNDGAAALLAVVTGAATATAAWAAPAIRLLATLGEE
jgi:hypothetical protein